MSLYSTLYACDHRDIKKRVNNIRKIYLMGPWYALVVSISNKYSLFARSFAICSIKINKFDD